jgi:spore coat protein JB
MIHEEGRKAACAPHSACILRMADLPLGRALVRMQVYGDLYPIEQGLWRGTVFRELNPVLRPCEAQPASVDGVAALAERVRALTFAAMDLNLYLDTHPGDTQAVDEYNSVCQRLCAQRRCLEKACGPTRNFGDSRMEHGRHWVDGPWPWHEGGGRDVEL